MNDTITIEAVATDGEKWIYNARFSLDVALRLLHALNTKTDGLSANDILKQAKNAVHKFTDSHPGISGAFLPETIGNDLK